MIGRNIILSDNLGDIEFILGFYILCLLPIAEKEALKQWAWFFACGVSLLIAFTIASDQPRVAGSTGSMLLILGGVNVLSGIAVDMFPIAAINKVFLTLLLGIVLIVTIYWKSMTNWCDVFGIFLPERIESGPAKGLYTTVENKERYDRNMGFVRNLPETTRNTIVINSIFSYLMTEKRCGTYSTWSTGIIDERAKWYSDEHNGMLPDIIVCSGGDLQSLGYLGMLVRDNRYSLIVTDYGEYYLLSE